MPNAAPCPLGITGAVGTVRLGTAHTITIVAGVRLRPARVFPGHDLTAA